MRFRIDTDDHGLRHLFAVDTDGNEHPIGDPDGYADDHAAITAARGIAPRWDLGLVAATPPEQMHWEGVIVMEGRVPTGDGRAIEDEALSWEVPFPLTWDPEHGGHGGRVVGTVWEVERRDGGQVWGRGTFDLAAPASEDYPRGIGYEAARHVAEALTDGASIEPDQYDVEVRVRQEVIDAWEDDLEAMEDGEVETEDDQPDEDGRVLLDTYRHDDFLEVVTNGRIRTLALVTTPAFDESRLGLVDGFVLDGTAPDPADEADAVAASAGRPQPDVTWFADPGLEGPTPLTVEDDGRIYGHIATWDTCHVGRDDICLTPPRSNAGYAYFTTGEFECATCEDRPRVPVGAITMDTGHASLSSGHRQSVAHYDNTGTVVADIAAGEDDFGIWFAGRVRPEVLDDPDRLAALRASSLSGDWRRIGGNLELVAALAVNVPGFPIPRSVAASGASEVDIEARGHVEDGRQIALVASGMVTHPAPAEQPSGGLDQPTREMLARIDRYVRRQEAAKVRARVEPSVEAVAEYQEQRAEAARARVHPG